MRSEFVHLVMMALILVFGGAAEELLPKAMGVGFPVLLAAVQYVAARGRNAYWALAFAAAAGAVEDALSGLPALTGSGFFLLTAATVRWAHLPTGAVALTYPLFQIWLSLWLVEAQGNFFSRLLMALPFGLLTELAVWGALAWGARKAAIDGAE